MFSDPRVLDLLQRWEEQNDNGQPVTPEELCGECHELLEPVRQGIAALRNLSPLLDDVPSAATAEDLGTAALPTDRFNGLRFRPLQLHRKGGQGEVFLAFDSELNRNVALKRIQDNYSQDADARRRFLREAEVTGRLEHPGIVPVYSLGCDAAGEPYYTMRFIEGQSLKDAIDAFHKADRQPGRDPGERSLAFRELLNRFIAVCKAVAYAHSRGVVHRDLKPGNVMLGKYGETQLVDWGLAKAIGRVEAQRTDAEKTLRPSTDADGEHTRPGAAAGTPAFMSPEQARGAWDKVGPASDVYSLGVTLYVILAGLPPFDGRDSDDVLCKVLRGEYAPARQVKEKVPRALDAVCRKAMALRPEDRYASSLALAKDIESWMADEAVTAYTEGRLPRLLRWSRQHKAAVAAAVAALLGATLLGGFGWLYLRSERATQIAETTSDVEKMLPLLERKLANTATASVEDLSPWEDVLGEVDKIRARIAGRELAPFTLARVEARFGEIKASREAAVRSAAQAKKNRLMLERLVDLRSRPKNDFARFDPDADYDRAFREFGVDVNVLTPERAGELIRSRPLEVAISLAAGLDDWASRLREAPILRVHPDQSAGILASVMDSRQVLLSKPRAER